MTDPFDRAFEILLEHEGRFSNDPFDRGGKTKFGISQAAYPKLDIENLTVDAAKSIYLVDYWVKNGCDRMPWWAALCVFDCGVNQGVRTAAGLIQQAVRVFQDQRVGPMTLKAIRKADPMEAMATFQALRAARYVNTLGYDRFGHGWLRRVMKTTAYAMEADDAAI